jgi:hypothetical protein
VPTEEQVEAGTHTTFSAKHMLSLDRPIPDALLAMGRVDCMPAAELAERVQSSGMQKVVDDLQKGKVGVLGGLMYGLSGQRSKRALCCSARLCSR